MSAHGLKRGSSSLDASSSKKPRFNPRNPLTLTSISHDEHDAVLEADVIGPRGPQHKRNAVEIDGYDSDSDGNENFDQRAAAKAKRERLAKSQQQEEEDMFADLKADFNHDGDGSDDGSKKKKKAVTFVDAGDLIEDKGEDLTSKSGGHVSSKLKLDDGDTDDVSSSSEEEVDDETRADIGDIDEELGAGSKKLHAPKLDAFNMRDEQEIGAFDSAGNYIRHTTDPDAVHDSWLEGLSKKEMRKAKEAADKREQDRRKRDLENDSKSVGDVLKELIPLLQTGETVLEALARLGKGKKKEKPKWATKQKNRKVNGHTDDAGMEEEDSAETRRRREVEDITAAADLLLTKGQAEVYDTERELLIRQYTRESGDLWAEPAPTDLEDLSEKTWEFRWTDARDGGNVNGPYDANTMRHWSEAGYFKDGVEFREAGDEEWSRVADF